LILSCRSGLATPCVKNAAGRSGSVGPQLRAAAGARESRQLARSARGNLVIRACKPLPQANLGNVTIRKDDNTTIMKFDRRTQPNQHAALQVPRPASQPRPASFSPPRDRERARPLPRYPSPGKKNPDPTHQPQSLLSHQPHAALWKNISVAATQSCRPSLSPTDPLFAVAWKYRYPRRTHSRSVPRLPLSR
jgi:hypothetical protein